LKQVQGDILEQCIIEEHEKVSLQSNFEVEKSQMQQEKEQLIAEKIEVNEEVNGSLRSMTGLELQAKDQVMHQVGKLIESVQKLQQ
jgi:hypothetical protein